jgi:hypothetical protein
MAITALKFNHKNDIIIYPEKIDFGSIDRGNVYQTKLMIRNNQDLMQRVNVRPPIYNPHISITNSEGPIAPGLSKVRKRSIKETSFEMFKMILKS